MISKVIGLELKKHRKSFVGLLLVIVLSIVVFALAGRIQKISVKDAISAGLELLSLTGIPFLAMLFGSLCGHGLKRDPDQQAEEPLPVRPGARVTGSLLVGGFYFLLSSLFLTAMNPGYSKFLQSDQVYWFLLTCCRLYLLAFALSYWMRSPVLAAGLSLVCSIADIPMLIMALERLVRFQWTWTLLEALGYSGLFLVTSVIFASINFFVLLHLAPRISRAVNLGMAHKIILGMLLFSSLCISISILTIFRY